MTAREVVETFAAARGLLVQWEGSIGFGRDCVGLLRPGLSELASEYVSWGEGAEPPEAVRHAYHKHDSIAVLGRGPAAEGELAAWCVDLALRGVRIDRRSKDVEDVGALFFGTRDEFVATVPRSEEALV